MTASPGSAADTLPFPEQANGHPAVEGAARAAPVIVLTYAYAGTQRLRDLLSGYPELACTSGTGVLPLCEQAADTWRQVEGRPGGAAGPAGSLSVLAVTSVHALATGMITMIVARSGGRRWCETAIAQPGGAEVFLQVFPGTRFLCLHRSCPDVIRATLAVSPWGLSGPAFAPFTAAHPASSVAALAAYWVAHAGPLLAFERAHPGACHRIRCEDLAADPERADSGIRAFLGLTEEGVARFPRMAGGGEARVRGATGDPGAASGIADGLGPSGLSGPSGSADAGEGGRAPDDAPGVGDAQARGGVQAAGTAGVLAGTASPGSPGPPGLPQLPVGQIPSPLLAQVNDLHAQLAYPPLDAAGDR